MVPNTLWLDKSKAAMGCFDKFDEAEHGSEGHVLSNRREDVISKLEVQLSSHFA